MSDGVLIGGYVTKLGAVVKNWKLRWMVLHKDGKLEYYKKQPQPGDEPQGSVAITSDCVRLLEWEHLQVSGLVKWPPGTPERSGFALGTRGGRMYFMHCESHEACAKWVQAIRSVGANIVHEPGTVVGPSAFAAEKEQALHAIAAAEAMSSGASGSGNGTDTGLGGQRRETANKCYVHKIVGGMVVKAEFTPK